MRLLLFGVCELQKVGCLDRSHMRRDATSKTKKFGVLASLIRRLRSVSAIVYNQSMYNQSKTKGVTDLLRSELLAPGNSLLVDKLDSKETVE